jgi:predicted ABC-type transport system involved in lysophospholipase L1 biosynthesis ATPase subunit
MDTVIQIRDVVKHYGSGASQVRALQGVDLDVRAGEVLALMCVAASVISIRKATEIDPAMVFRV